MSSGFTSVKSVQHLVPMTTHLLFSVSFSYNLLKIYNTKMYPTMYTLRCIWNLPNKEWHKLGMHSILLNGAEIVQILMHLNPLKYDKYCIYFV